MENPISNNSYRLLKNSADQLLKNHLQRFHSNEDFHCFRRYVMNEILDPYNVKLPGDLVIEYYNYCIENFKSKKEI